MKDAERTEFFELWYPKMIGMGLAAGARHADAEDAASAVAFCVLRSWERWTAVEKKYCYLRTAVKHELDTTRKRRAARLARETRWVRNLLQPGRDSAADSYHRAREPESVRQALAISPRRQREILAWLCLRRQAGWDVKDVADALGISQDTLRRHRQNARRTLEPFLVGDGHEHRRWLRAGERVHEDFHRGHANLLAPRPVILDAWRLARERGLNPERGTEAVLVDADELRQRRRNSPLPALAALTDLAARNELLAVVLDADDIVLHRGGHRSALAAADRLGYLEGACWNLDRAGVNAAGLAPIVGGQVTVNRWEHTFPDQHGLCCTAIPIRVPHGGHITLNLTATADSLATLPRAVQHQLNTMAQRLHRQLWTPPN
ncbi:hypothetical protein [Amycolatopsis alba]|uniref:Sigma-70 family RNA polymerase sigma factor n=1 Tax=Amycolatopsis alba DSM 44262 TaxID=1125972 RepID=A0A229R726_AMYAL|nr:hypothetical protein [Amycolatopsis alba]OXM42482.1 hypothetical protein CFP75_42490 [Amycolatopsis alba DSM 44262]